MNDMINIAEAAKMLGVKHSTINGWMFKKSMPFPYYKINQRCIRFNRQDVQNYIEGAKQNG